MTNRTITLGPWTFYLEERPTGMTLSVPDCGGMADSVPRVPEQLEWAERELAAVPGLVRFWSTAWNVPPAALASLVALFVRHGARWVPDDPP